MHRRRHVAARLGRYRLRMAARRRARIAIAFVAVLALAAPTVLAASRAVSIRDFAFSPKTVEIRVGDRVTWTNRDAVEHTATARNGSFDTGLLGDGESRSIRFNVAGTYRYVCTPHPSMTGTVVVRAAAGGLQPPNTDTVAVVDLGTDASDTGPLGELAILGLIAGLLTLRAFRRRHETA
jgi:plastocyanin